MATASDPEGENEAQQHYYCTEEPKAAKRVVIDYPYKVIRTVDTDYYRIIEDVNSRLAALAEAAKLRAQTKSMLHGGALWKAPEQNGKAGSPNQAQPDGPPGPKPLGDRKPPRPDIPPRDEAREFTPPPEAFRDVGELRRQLLREGVMRSNPSNWGKAHSKSKG